jgi:hypothetical protein
VLCTSQRVSSFKLGLSSFSVKRSLIKFPFIYLCYLYIWIDMWQNKGKPISPIQYNRSLNPQYIGIIFCWHIVPLLNFVSSYRRKSHFFVAIEYVDISLFKRHIWQGQKGVVSYCLTLTFKLCCIIKILQDFLPWHSHRYPSISAAKCAQPPNLESQLPVIPPVPAANSQLTHNLQHNLRQQLAL